MVELRHLDTLLRVLGVRLQSSWDLSAVSRSADTLSRTWDPGDVGTTSGLIQSMQEGYGLHRVIFNGRLLGETMVTRMKYLCTQMQEDCGNGKG